MANARLHIICGNCGSVEFKPFEDSGIHCLSCGTIHFFEEVLERLTEKFSPKESE